MKFGFAVRGQFPQGDDMSLRFAELMEQARTAKALGFDAILKSSHYSSLPFQDVQQLPFLARVAAEAPGLRLITGIVLLALHKPLDIAEQLASLDLISGGLLGPVDNYRNQTMAHAMLIMARKLRAVFS